jgi:hypothetical protein
VAVVTGDTTSAWTMSVTDNKSNTWIKAVGVENDGDTSHRTRAEVWYVANATGGATHTVSVTPSTAATCAIGIAEYDPTGSPVTLDSTGTGTGNSTAPSCSVTAASSADLFVGAACVPRDSSGPIWKIEGGWTNVYTQGPQTDGGTEGISFETLGEITTQSPGSQTASWTIGATHQWAAVVAAFQPSAGTFDPSTGFPWPQSYVQPKKVTRIVSY